MNFLLRSMSKYRVSDTDADTIAKQLVTIATTGENNPDWLGDPQGNDDNEEE